MGIVTVQGAVQTCRHKTAMKPQVLHNEICDISVQISKRDCDSNIKPFLCFRFFFFKTPKLCSLLKMHDKLCCFSAVPHSNAATVIYSHLRGY